MSTFEAVTDLDVTDYDLGQDPARDELLGVQKDERVAVIRSSDRMSFKRCRRRWNWTSHLRQNLTTIESASPLWFGSGMHFAWEDYHGPRKYAHPRDAFKDYVKATYTASKRGNFFLPPDWPDLAVLGVKMLEYYADVWLINRDPLRTFIFNGVPQVEVHALVPIPITTPWYDRVLYAVTLDRVVEEEDGKLAILDYKTAKRFQTHFLQTDPQISAYCWIGNQLYPGRRIDSFIYQQHRKDAPIEPRRLSDGTFSTAKGQLTTRSLYKKALVNQYGDVMNAPIENLDYLNWLGTQEDDNHDRFIRRDRVRRNQHQSEAEGAKLLMELEEMLNPDVPLYPNPTRECGSMCAFNTACINMDDGSDFEHEIQMGFRTKDADFDHWRKFLPEDKR